MSYGAGSPSGTGNFHLDMSGSHLNLKVIAENFQKMMDKEYSPKTKKASDNTKQKTKKILPE